VARLELRRRFTVRYDALAYRLAFSEPRFPQARLPRGCRLEKMPQPRSLKRAEPAGSIDEAVRTEANVPETADSLLMMLSSTSLKFSAVPSVFQGLRFRASRQGPSATLFMVIYYL